MSIAYRFRPATGFAETIRRQIFDMACPTCGLATPDGACPDCVGDAAVIFDSRESRRVHGFGEGVLPLQSERLPVGPRRLDDAWRVGFELGRDMVPAHAPSGYAIDEIISFVHGYADGKAATMAERDAIFDAAEAWDAVNSADADFAGAVAGW